MVKTARCLSFGPRCRIKKIEHMHCTAPGAMSPSASYLVVRHSVESLNFCATKLSLRSSNFQQRRLSSHVVFASQAALTLWAARNPGRLSYRVAIVNLL